MSFIGNAVDSVVGGAKDVLNGLTGKTAADAAKDAASTQADASAQNLDWLHELLNTQLAVSQPARSIGNQSLSQLAKLYGMQGNFDPSGGINTAGTGGLSAPAKPLIVGTNTVTGGPARNAPAGATATAGAPDYSQFYQTPDYQVRLKEGNQAIDRSAAAKGTLYSGGTLKALSDYNADSATKGFGGYVNQLNTMAGLGQNANASSNSALSSVGGAISDNITNAGNNAASGQINAANAQTGAYGNLASLGALGAMAYLL